MGALSPIPIWENSPGGKVILYKIHFHLTPDCADVHNVVVLSLSLHPSPSSAPSNVCVDPCQLPLPRSLPLWPASALTRSNSQPVATENICDTDCFSLPCLAVQSTQPPLAVILSRYTIGQRFNVHLVAEDIVLGRAHADLDEKHDKMK